jgi:hypothetical protein
MGTRRAKNGGEVEEKLDVVIGLLQDLFVLEATRSGIGPGEIRKLLGVAMARVTNISKHID